MAFQARSNLRTLWKKHSRILKGQRMRYGLVATWMVIIVHVAVISQGYTTYPALTQACYSQLQSSSMYPSNSCCKTHNYTKNDILTCINKSMEIVHPRQHSNGHDNLREKPSGGPQSARMSFIREVHSKEPLKRLQNSATSAQHTNDITSISASKNSIVWVMVGDSRVRQVFSALVTRLSGPRLKYKKPSTMEKWRSIHELAEILRIGKLHEDIEVCHTDIPVELKFYWDPQLQRLPTMLQKWALNQTETPSLLLLGTGLHWMRKSLHTYRTSGLEAAAYRFKLHMETLRPQLVNMATFTDIIFQLQDPVQESKIFPKYRGVYSNKNIELYNSIISSTFLKSDVKVWDSNIPLAKYYFAQCRRHHQQSFDKLWDCESPIHSGYIVVEEYANILLNNVCNRYLDLSDLYC